MVKENNYQFYLRHKEYLDNLVKRLTKEPLTSRSAKDILKDHIKRLKDIEKEKRKGVKQ